MNRLPVSLPILGADRGGLLLSDQEPSSLSV
jgi:hypothetical protein